MSVVCGDDVLCERDAAHDEITVTETRPRQTALYRSNLRGEAEAIVANVSQLFVVLAPKPVPDLFVVDRYVAAATSNCRLMISLTYCLPSLRKKTCPAEMPSGCSPS